MNDIIANLEEEIKNNQYYLDNFEYLTETDKYLDEALNLFSNNKSEEAVQKLSKINRDKLIRLVILIYSFYDKKEDHDLASEALSFFMYDGKNLDVKMCKYQMFMDLCLIVNNGEASTQPKKIVKKQKKLYKDLCGIYGEEYIDSYIKLCSNDRFPLVFVALYYFNDIFTYNFKNIDIVRGLWHLQNHNNLVNSIVNYLENEDSRVKFAIYSLYIFFVDVKKYIDKYRKELRLKRKENALLSSKLERLKLICEKKDKEIITRKDLTDIVEDDENMIKILETVAISNARLEKQKQTSFGKKEQIIYMLHNYKYNFDKLDEKTKNNITSINIKVLNQNLEILDKLNIILTYRNLSYILSFNNTINTTNFKALISKGYLNNHILNNNITLLTSLSELQNFMDNVSILEKYKISVEIINLYYDILFINNKYLNSIFDIYSTYGITINSDNFIKLLDVTNLDLIDSFIEEGYGEFIKKNIHKLEEGQLLIRRIHINNIIEDESVLGNQINPELLSENTFFIKNKHLDDACCSKVNYFQNTTFKHLLDVSARINISDSTINSGIISRLDNLYREDECYNFDGVIISRNKVLRNLEALKESEGSLEEKVLNSMIYNSLLSIDELLTIKSSVTSLFQYNEKVLKY